MILPTSNQIIECKLSVFQLSRATYIENAMLMLWYQVYQEWRGLQSHSDVFLVEPDKLDIKRHFRFFFFLSCIVSSFNGEKTAKQVKSRRESVRICWRREGDMT